MRILESTLTPLVVLESAGVLAAVLELQHPESAPLVSHPITLVDVAAREFARPLAVAFVVLPVTVVNGPIGEFVCAPPLPQAVYELSGISA